MSGRPPLSRPVDLVIHIGTGKTGTSSIQAFLQQNREALAELGWLYPRSAGPRRHAKLSLFCLPDRKYEVNPEWNPQRWSSPDEFRTVFRRRLFKEIDESGAPRVLFSDEAFYGAPKDALRRLRRLTDRLIDRSASSLRLVVYLRRQDDHLVSRYQQVVKTGETRRLFEQGSQAGSPEDAGSWASRQGEGTYDYYTRLQMWKQLLEPTELVVRRFERERFVEGSLYQDFLDAAHIGARAETMEPGVNRNESLDAEAVEFLRILNIFRREHAEAAALPPHNRPLVVRLADACEGPTLTMPAPILDEFMARWAQPNQRVAREMLGDESGQLFRTPRKASNTTAEQYLDPARLDHYLTLLELPEQIHAPLRALVEREAKAH